MDEIKTDDQSPQRNTRQLKGGDQSGSQTNTSAVVGELDQIQVVGEKDKVAENPLSTPFLSKINPPADAKAAKILSEKQFFNNSQSRSSNFSMSNSNNSDDQNEGNLHLVDHDQNGIAKTFDNPNYGSNTQNGDQENILDQYRSSRPLIQEITNQTDAGLIPEAMPLIRNIGTFNTDENDIYARMKRGITTSYMSCKDPCFHDEVIEHWKCLKCNGNISRFGVTFDDNQGKVSHFTKIVYENSFLQDFKEDFKQQAVASGKPNSNGGTILYTAYQPNNMVELKEYMLMILCKKIKKVNKAAAGNLFKQSPFGSGGYQSLSGKLLKYLTHVKTKKEQLKQQYGENALVFDSMFESGNLLQAEKSPNLENTYNLYMQVDTNTRGHQQWFYFKAKGGRKGVDYTFNIMNFTKPGVTGGRGYKSGELGMRIMVKSKKQQIINNNFEKWEDLTNSEGNGQCEYVKTHVARRRKDVIAAGADSDQEDWVEEAFNKPQAAAPNQQNKEQQLPSINVTGPPQTGVSNIDPAAIKEKPKKRRVFYYYALRFNYQFKHDDDSVYFAFSQPVTYTEILTDIHNKEKILMPKTGWDKMNLKKPVPFIKAPSSRMMDMKEKEKTKEQPKEAVEEPSEAKYSIPKMMKENQFQKNILIENPQKLMYYHRTELCKTLSGIPLYQIVISRDQRSAKKNQIVLITSRVHSGESPGSQVFQGIYDFITSECREAKYLRRFYTFILIPCMNPDGVIIGNYRNSLAGVDLNRQWINPDTNFHPEVCAVKNLMQQIKEEDKRQIWIFCDLHGHSKKKNSFFYGCNTAANGGFLSWTIVRLLPRIFAQKTHMFNYRDCRFRVEPYKIGTARIVAWKQFQITHSFTLENSFYGYDIGEDEDRIFTQEDYKNVGLKFTMAIYEMHFLWKQIKRELQITHGWLKPRTLNDLTGVPAAQIMHEETAIIKEEERKKKAIEQYEQFLKTFYKSSKPVFMRKPKIDTGNQKDSKLDKEKAQAILEKSKLRERDRMVLEGNDKSHKSRNGLNGSKLLTEDIKDKSKTGKVQILPEGQEEDSTTDKNGNNDDIEAVLNLQPNEETLKEEDENSEDDSEFMFKMHEGLVKIQALIRGFLSRSRQKKKNLTQANKQLNKSISQQQQNNRGTSREIPRQRSNQILKKSLSKKGVGKLNPPSLMNLQVGYDTSSDGGMKGTAAGTTQVNNFESSNEDHLMRANTEQLNGKNLSDSGHMSNTGSKDTGNILGSLSQFGGKKGLNLQANWREFFEGEELDKAYQIVEVEQRDETDQESIGEESMGSNSNPSEDNFDEEEVYQNIYGLKNPEQYLEIRKAKEQEFIEKVNSETVTQQNLLQNITNVKTQEVKADKSQAQLENVENNNERKNSESETFMNDQSVEQNLNNDEDRKTIDEEKLMKTPKRLIQESESKRNENADRPKVQVSANHSPMNGQEQNQENLFSNLTGNGRRMLKSSIQQRAFTQAQNHPQSNMNLGGQQKPTVNPVYKMHNSNKKENINQVIKECFITKKMNTKNSASLNGRQTTGQSISPQKQFQISNKKNKQLNLKMNQSLSNQFTISQAGFNQGQGSNQSNPRAAMVKQGSNKKNRIDLQGNDRQGSNIEEALQNQNNILLQKIIQINLKNHNIRQSQNHNGNRRAQIQQNQNRMNEVITIQLLEHLNQQMSGMNTLQANQYMQIVLMQLLQTNKIQNGEQTQQNAQIQQQFANGQNGPSSEPGSQQNLAFYPQVIGQEQPGQSNQDFKEGDQSNQLHLQKNQQVKRLVSDHNVHAAGSNFDMSSTPVAIKRYSNPREQEIHVDKFKLPNESIDQGNIMYNSKKKPPSAQRSLKKAGDLVQQNTFVSNFNDNNQPELYKSESPQKHSQMKQAQNNFSSGKGMGSFYMERNSQPCEPSKFGQNFNAIDQQTFIQNQSNANQINSSSQNIGSSLFMKYIKKKANQEQMSSNFPNLYVNSQNADQMQASQMEYGSAGLPPQADKMLELNQMGSNPNQRQNKVNENVYFNDFSGKKQMNNKNDKEISQHQNMSKQRQNSNRIQSAAINSKHGPQVINQEIVNTKELINEIKQMRVHQQMQLQFQQQLQQQLQNQFQMQLQSTNHEQPQFVQFNQINYYENQKPQVFSDNYLASEQIQQNLQNQGVVKDMMQHLNVQNKQALLQPTQQPNYNSANTSSISQNFSAQKPPIYETSPLKTRPKKAQADSRQQVQLQAEDKIPQGLQALMNKQTNNHDMQHMIMSSTGYNQDKRHQQQQVQHNAVKIVPKSQYSSNPHKHQYISNHNSDMVVVSDKGRIRRAETRGAESRKDRAQNHQLTQAQYFHHNSNMKLNQPQNSTEIPIQAQQSIRAKSTYKGQNSKSQSNLNQQFQPNTGGQSSTNPQNKNINYSFKQQQQNIQNKY